MPLSSIITRQGVSIRIMRFKLRRSEKGLVCPCQVLGESNKYYEQEIDQRKELAEQTNERM
jgi:hypothetical protein